MAGEERLNDQERDVYDLIRLAGWEGKTTDEVEVSLKLTHQAASARVSELEHKHKLIEKRGAKRKTRAGRMAFIYVQKGLTPAKERLEK